LGGGSNDVGADISDRMGIIAQLLMNAGSGRGGAGIAEATAAANERSAARREDQRNKAMVNRMADKLEPSNPEMAMMMRANTKFGMAMLGKQLEDEWTSKSDMAKLNKEYELRGTNEQTLEAQKQAAKDKQMRLILEGAGLGSTVSTPPTPGAGGGTVAPVGGITPAVIGGTDSAVTAPQAGAVTTPQGGEPPATPATDNIPHEYYVGLPPGPAGQELLQQRLKHQDPEISLSEVTAYKQSLMSENETGRQKYFDNIRARTERQARVAGFDTRTNQVMRDNQALPGINLQQPGQPELMQAGINPNDPTVIPPNQVAQAGQYLRQAARTGEEQYTSALKDIMQPPSTGLEVNFGADGKVTSISQGGKSKKSPTEGEGKANVYYNQAVTALPNLNDPAVAEELMDPGIQNTMKAILPDNIATALSTDEFSMGTKSALAFVEAVVRYKSGAQITPIEMESNMQIFVPQFGDKGKPKTIAFKRLQREKVLRAMGEGRNIDQITKEGFEDLNKAMEVGLVEPGEKVIPPMPDWAKAANVSPEAWAAAGPEEWFPTDQVSKKQ